LNRERGGELVLFYCVLLQRTARTEEKTVSEQDNKEKRGVRGEEKKGECN
jgi:hypothetical protein